MGQGAEAERLLSDWISRLLKVGASSCEAETAAGCDAAKRNTFTIVAPSIARVEPACGGEGGADAWACLAHAQITA
eukprot:4295791-Pleurochrysis_carterae.AAC.1